MQTKEMLPHEFRAHRYYDRENCLEDMGVVINNLGSKKECLEQAEKTLGLMWSHNVESDIQNMAFNLMVECRQRIMAIDMLEAA